MAATGIALVLGGGPRIGWGVAQQFLAEGYRVAIGSRTPNVEKAAKYNVLPVSVDVSSIQSVENAFAEVKRSIGVPNVVVYNAAAITFPQNAEDPFTITPQDLERDNAVNAIGAYTALRESIHAFRELDGNDIPKAFIATGNVTPFNPIPMALTLGSGKASLTHMIDIATKVHGKDNFRFYFASQVTPDGGAVPYPDVKAEAHASVYWKLVNQATQGPWDIRFQGDGVELAS